MHEHHEHEAHDDSDDDSPERADEIRPRIYVASLADYNEGRLHGVWIDANQSEDELRSSIGDMLRQSPVPGAEEWAIHDYEGFGPWWPEESESLTVVARVAAGIAEHGPAFAAWIAAVGTDEDDVEAFADCYMGEWESGVDYVRESLDDMGVVDDLMRSVPEYLAPYVKLDYVGYFKDLVIDGALLTQEKPGGGVYVFLNS